jgi:hypothetical protein
MMPAGRRKNFINGMLTSLLLNVLKKKTKHAVGVSEYSIADTE